MLLQIKIKMVFSATVVIVLLGACAQNEPLSATQSNSAASLKTEIFRPVSDVPIPKDAALNAERSLILSDRDEWTGRLVMYSSITATEAYAFYKTQMPLFDWTPIMSIQSETSVLTFSRTERAATIQIERRALGGSSITVTVARAQDTIQSSQIKPSGQQLR
ncbi:MAG: hypothetical protein CMP14_06220 [Rickettsiales bacterium]|jgi:hypothetical protein|nr:hypothetical protein [Rickettsiales bacterium]|tara:strand:- start:490 stop:975 length:486 start_codon:yes stop_codon:yes gene_type:complete